MGRRSSSGRLRRVRRRRFPVSNCETFLTAASTSNRHERNRLSWREKGEKGPNSQQSLNLIPVFSKFARVQPHTGSNSIYSFWRHPLSEDLSIPPRCLPARFVTSWAPGLVMRGTRHHDSNLGQKEKSQIVTMSWSDWDSNLGPLGLQCSTTPFQTMFLAAGLAMAFLGPSIRARNLH